VPIIVDEVVISVEVGNQSAADSVGGTPSATTDDKQALVAECVERLLDILRERGER